MFFRFIIAFFAGKLARFVLLKMHRRATHFPGKLAVKICPDFVKYVGKPKHVICVTGTNGKTSTCNMIKDCLRRGGVSVLDNSFGSNTIAGTAATLLAGVSVFNKPKYDTLVLEVDERSSMLIFEHLKPTYLICTNLFRDSIMRNAHTEFIFTIIGANLPYETTLILNGDDCISNRLGRGKNKKRLFFAVDELEGEQTEDDNIINDARTCPDCGAKMVFTFKRYHHIGHAHCSKCSLSTLPANYTVVGVGENRLKMRFSGTEHVFPLISGTVFNIYNQAAVVAFLHDYGFSADEIASLFEGVTIADTRYSEMRCGGVNVSFTMLKGLNPIACSRNCHTARILEGRKAVFFMVDDVNHERDDCENVSWHYEADYEQLADADIERIYVAGPRAQDIKYRLLLAGVGKDAITTADNEEKLAQLVSFDGIDTLLVFYDMFRFDDLENTVKPIIKRRGDAFAAAGRKSAEGQSHDDD